ncbi:RrF2 family transcriptional regulator [Alkalibacter mobilis]|uniref:RrF2 family transcriptional regulator n=1 Tax=Alkalibacter mobilis TaxID=2787712 RepID=UPI00189E4C45|nr:Rrf2 family transcriptional regulator [Alkalibacter mobilis]MBF7096031.1 Rrf2 family transcriptional regulator [Alkalibacter mobilis]
MKISTKGRYALEAVLDLACHSKEELESLKNIAMRLDKSKNYLEQLFVILRKSQLIESVRGAQGGYRLARTPETITAGDIIRSVEGSMAPVGCLEAGIDACECGNYKICPTRDVWGGIESRINEVLDSVTLKDLMDCYESYSGKNELEYYI